MLQVVEELTRQCLDCRAAVDHHRLTASNDLDILRQSTPAHGSTPIMRLQAYDLHPVRIGRNVTSVTVELPIWERFKIIAKLEGVTIGSLVDAIDRTMRVEPPIRGRRQIRTLSSAIRIFVFEHSELKIKRKR
jgi:predicted DNA-binding ribbon-helix-helix protein